MKKKMYGTNYRVATKWLGNSLIMCNDIPQIDGSVWDNMRFSLEDEEGNYQEIYQWFLTDCSDFEAKWLEEHFGLHFTYSDLLGMYVLCVLHFGTAWDYVYCECDFPEGERELGQDK